MSFTLAEQESWAKQKRSIDNWRQDVAYLAQPIVIPTRNPAFQRGVPAPIEVSVDDGTSFKSGPRSVSVREYQSRPEEPRVVRRRTLVRRPSSDHGGYSRTRRSEARSPSRTRVIVERAAPRRRSSSHHHDRVEVMREESLPRRSIRAPTKPPPSSFLNSFFPSTRSTRSRTATYENPPSYERSSYERQRTRDISPRYRTARDLEPDVIRHRPRPKSVYSPQQQPAVGSRQSTMRSGSVDINERMKLLAVRDRFRDEIDRARGEWRGARPEQQRYREYDRRTVR